jgi:hypothetical protein
MRNIIIGATLLGFYACGPAKSEIQVETVNPALVTQLINQASDSVWIARDSLQNIPPIWVNGLMLQFDESGKKATIWYDEQNRVAGLVEYRQNVLTDSIQFFPNGQRIFRFLFNKDGKPSGPAKFFYEDGRIREDGRFENGIKTGVWRRFRPDGTLDMVNEFDRYGEPKR